LFLSERRQRVSGRMIQETVKKWRRFCRARHKRHEYAARLVERGVPLAQVRDLLGHASIRTTERDDNQRMEALQAAAARLETGKTLDAGTHETDEVSTLLQVSEEPWPPDSGGLDHELLETIEAV
jgi:hypothetical protein